QNCVDRLSCLHCCTPSSIAKYPENHAGTLILPFSKRRHVHCKRPMRRTREGSGQVLKGDQMDYVAPGEIVSDALKAAVKKAGLPARDMLIRGALSGVFLGYATSLVF